MQVFQSIIFLFFCIVLFNQGHFEISAQDNWEEIKSHHFVVYYPENKKTFAKQVLRVAEQDYFRVADYLRYSRRSNFWTWNNRVKIYLYPDKFTYLKETAALQASNGMADYDQKTIYSFLESPDFLESILPHEIAHLIFRDFVGFHKNVPLWLDEGIAQWAEVKNRKERHEIAKSYAKAGMLLPLKRMMIINI
ncbi:MAG: hypothetical protein JW734_08430 [Candidatus Omnitrophica bacterium]|nr:hypothetical protein [Candidatus Omnitrophota bacterium]